MTDGENKNKEKYFRIHIDEHEENPKKVEKNRDEAGLSANSLRSGKNRSFNDPVILFLTTLKE